MTALFLIGATGTRTREVAQALEARGWLAAVLEEVAFGSRDEYAQAVLELDVHNIDSLLAQALRELLADVAGLASQESEGRRLTADENVVITLPAGVFEFAAQGANLTESLVDESIRVRGFAAIQLRAPLSALVTRNHLMGAATPPVMVRKVLRDSIAAFESRAARFTSLVISEESHDDYLEHCVCQIAEFTASGR